MVANHRTQRSNSPTSQPATSQPATSQPATWQPATSQPATSQPATSQVIPPSGIQIDQSTSMVRVDGIPIGKRVVSGGKVYLQVCDKDQRRADQRGTRYPLVDLKDLANALNQDSNNK